MEGLSVAYLKLVILVLQVLYKVLILVDQVQSIEHVLVTGERIFVLVTLGVSEVEVLLSFFFSVIKDVQHVGTVCQELFLVNFELIKNLFFLIEIFDHTLVVIEA